MPLVNLQVLRARQLYVLILMIVFVITEARAHAQFSFEEGQTSLPSSTHEVSRDNQLSSIEAAPLNQLPAGPCRLRVPDAILQAKAKDTVPINEPLPYTPLSAHCKFKIFLTSTYSPYTFLSAGFQATLDQAEDQWPHYGG